jgi:methyl farnesoate epoxidase/farnesoate epoxidase
MESYRFAQHTLVLADLWRLLHDREQWGDPEVFRPERCLDENKNFFKDEWVVSFGAGKRACLGAVLARDGIFCTFTSLLQVFLSSLPEDVPVPQMSRKYIVLSAIQSKDYTKKNLESVS